MLTDFFHRIQSEGAAALELGHRSPEYTIRLARMKSPSRAYSFSHSEYGTRRVIIGWDRMKFTSNRLFQDSRITAVAFSNLTTMDSSSMDGDSIVQPMDTTTSSPPIEPLKETVDFQALFSGALDNEEE